MNKVDLSNSIYAIRESAMDLRSHAEDINGFDLNDMCDDMDELIDKFESRCRELDEKNKLKYERSVIKTTLGDRTAVLLMIEYLNSNRNTESIIADNLKAEIRFHYDDNNNFTKISIRNETISLPLINALDNYFSGKSDLQPMEEQLMCAIKCLDMAHLRTLINIILDNWYTEIMKIITELNGDV